MENEIAKYRKKKPSNISKSVAKADHKHNYIDCNYVHYWTNPINGNKVPNIFRGSYCSCCGKIQLGTWITNKEQIDKSLKTFVLDDMFEQKFLIDF